MHATPLPTVCNTYSNHPRKITICLSLLFSFCLLHMRFSFRDAERQAVLKRPRIVTIIRKETHCQCEQQRNPKFIPKFVCTTDTVTIHQRTRLGVLAARRTKPGGSSLARRSMSMRTSAANRLADCTLLVPFTKQRFFLRIRPGALNEEQNVQPWLRIVVVGEAR